MAAPIETRGLTAAALVSQASATRPGRHGVGRPLQDRRVSSAKRASALRQRLR